jgi:hypothetical protein
MEQNVLRDRICKRILDLITQKTAYYQVHIFFDNQERFINSPAIELPQKIKISSNLATSYQIRKTERDCL